MKRRCKEEVKKGVKEVRKIKRRGGKGSEEKEKEVKERKVKESRRRNKGILPT